MQISVERLFRKLALDVGLDSRTVYYCIRRFRSEGLQFFTVTLPALSKSVMASLELGYFERPKSFAWKGRSLLYFRSLLKGVFDQRSGLVLDDVCPVAINSIRQICEYFYKLVLKFRPRQERKAEADYISCEQEVRSFRADRKWIKILQKHMFKLFPFLNRDTIYDVLGNNRPRYTKGSFAGSGKQCVGYFQYKMLPDHVVGTTLSKYDGISGYFKPYPSSPTAISKVAQDTADRAEVLFVPKDSRGPRVISKEPMHQLRLQMAFFDWFSKKLENSTNRRINFADQSINRSLAREGSKSRTITTVDLKEASDRLSANFVADLFEHCSVVRYFVRTRSLRYALPSGKTGRMHKLSGMGSGLTFSLLAFVVYLSVVAAICERTPKVLHSYIRRNVYVYGDDLVLPTRFYDMAVQGLERSGLKVNLSKSFSKSYFRESCGGDYYYGNNVTPVRLRLSNSRVSFNKDFRSLDLQGFSFPVLQVERHCRELVKKSLYYTADFLYSAIESQTGPLPRIAGDSPVIGRWNEDSFDYETDVHGNYISINAYVPSPVKASSKGLCPYKALSHHLKPTKVSWRDVVYPDEGSLASEVTVPREVKLYRRKVSAFRLMG